MYAIHLIDDKGFGSFLSVKGRTEWKTKRTAIKHAKDIKTLVDKGKFGSIVTVDIENGFGELIKW